MKRILIVFCFSLLSVLGGLAQEDWEKKVVEDMKKVDEAVYNGDYEKSWRIFENVTEIIKEKRGENSDVYMSCSNALNKFYMKDMKIQKARKGCLENYERCKKYRNRNPQNFIDATQCLAEFCILIEDFTTTENLYLALLSYHSDDSYSRVDILYNLATINYQISDYIKAESYSLEALKICEKLQYEKVHYIRSHANICNILGMIYFQTGRSAKSKECFLKAIEIANKVNNPKDRVILEEVYATSFSNLGYFYINLNDENMAETYLLKSLEYASNDERLHARTYYYLAELYLSKNDIESELKYLLKVFNYYKKNNIQDKTYYYVLSYLIKYDIILKGSEIESYINILKILSNKYGKADLIYIKALYNLAEIYETQDDIKNAKLLYAESITYLVQYLLKNILLLTEQEKFQYTKSLNYQYNNLHRFAFEYHVKHPSVSRDLFNFILLSKKTILLNTIRIKQIIENSDNNIVKSNYKKLKETKYRISNKNITHDTLITLRKKAEELQKEISMQIQSEYSDIDFVNFHDFNKIKENISKNEAVIEFTNFQKIIKDGAFNKINKDTTHYCALITKKDFKYPKLIYLCTKKELEKALSKENNFTNTAQHITNIYEADNKLYKYLFEKIEPYLKDVKVVNISASGLVHNIAFSCLKDNNNTYLKDKYLIKYYVSFADLNKETDVSINSQNTHKVALFGNMKYDLNSEEIQQIETKNITRGINSAFMFEEEKATVKLSPLPDTKQEVDSIANILSTNNIACSKYTGKDANEDNFYKLDASETDILHIATHGFYFANEKQKRQFLPLMTNLNPIDNSYLKNGLFFSGASNSLKKDSKMTKISDGILSAYEICNLNLSKTKLVVLSACLTGIGDIKQNEGVIGLSRAFKIAGVKYMLLSLWEIPSRQTTEFMINFYKNALSNMSVEQAFNKTQQLMSEKYKNPYFWGGFILLR